MNNSKHNKKWILIVSLIIMWMFLNPFVVKAEENIPVLDTFNTNIEGEIPDEKITENIVVKNHSEGWKYYYQILNNQSYDARKGGEISLSNHELVIKNLKYGDNVKYWASNGKKTTKYIYKKYITTNLLNGSFELGEVNKPYYWKNTAFNRKIVTSNKPQNFNLPDARDGENFSFLNGGGNEENISLYQELSTSAGKKYKWSLYHAGYSGSDTMAIIMGPGIVDTDNLYTKANTDSKDMFQEIVDYLRKQYGDKDGNVKSDKTYTVIYRDKNYQVKVVTSEAGKWSYYSGVYSATEDENGLTVIGFTSLNVADKITRKGNIIDGVKFQESFVPEDAKVDQIEIPEKATKNIKLYLFDMPMGAECGEIRIPSDNEIKISNCKIKGKDLSFDAESSKPGSTATIFIPVTTDYYSDYEIMVKIKSVAKTDAFIDGIKLKNAGEMYDTNCYSKVYDGIAVEAEGTPEVKNAEGVVQNAFIYQWYQIKKNGNLVELEKAPSDVGNYKLIVYVGRYYNINHNISSEYSFKITKKLVKSPFIKDAIYTGNVQRAQISDTDNYVVERNEGGINAGQYDVILRLKDKKNYGWDTKEDVYESRVNLKFNIKKKSSSIKTEPKVRSLIYTGSEQELIKPATAINGIVKYSLDRKKWDATIPKAVEVGSYKIYYKVFGNSNYADSEEKIVTVKILPKEEKNALNKGLKVSQTSGKITISWNQVKEATGYDVYIQSCAKNFNSKSFSKVKNGKTTKLVVKKVDGKKIENNTIYKVYVVAYKQSGKQKVQLGKSIIAHVTSNKNSKFTNVKSIKLSKESYTLKVGTQVKIKAKTILVDNKKKQLSNDHAKEFRYLSNDKKVATVSNTGQIQAVKKGVCTIYVYARNGYTKQIKIIVK